MPRDFTKVPTDLTHKPIYAINNCPFLGEDVIGLSIGKAQWDSEGFSPSVKVWRTSDKNGKLKVSAQSEETTFTRAIDMAAMIIAVVGNVLNDKEIKGFIDIHEKINIETMRTDLIEQLEENIKQNSDIIKAHINLLKQALNEGGF